MLTADGRWSHDLWGDCHRSKLNASILMENLTLALDSAVVRHFDFLWLFHYWRANSAVGSAFCTRLVDIGWGEGQGHVCCMRRKHSCSWRFHRGTTSAGRIFDIFDFTGDRSSCARQTRNLFADDDRHRGVCPHSHALPPSPRCPSSVSPTRSTSHNGCNRSRRLAQ